MLLEGAPGDMPIRQAIDFLNGTGLYKVRSESGQRFVISGRFSYIECLKPMTSSEYDELMDAMGLQQSTYTSKDWLAVSVKELMAMVVKLSEKYDIKGHRIVTKAEFFFDEIAKIYHDKERVIICGPSKIQDFATRLRKELNVEDDDFYGMQNIGSLFENLTKPFGTVEEAIRFLKGLGYETGMGGLSPYVYGKFPVLKLQVKADDSTVDLVRELVGINTASHAIYLFADHKAAQEAIHKLGEGLPKIGGMSFTKNGDNVTIWKMGSDNRRKNAGSINLNPKEVDRYMLYEEDFIDLANRIALTMDPDDVFGVNTIGELLESRVPTFAQWCSQLV